jgi:hypothetical protein
VSPTSANYDGDQSGDETADETELTKRTDANELGKPGKHACMHSSTTNVQDAGGRLLGGTGRANQPTNQPTKCTSQASRWSPHTQNLSMSKQRQVKSTSTGFSPVETGEPAHSETHVHNLLWVVNENFSPIDLLKFLS